jgi:hypothetical protein
LFEADFADSKKLVGQIVNFYVQALLVQSSVEPPPVVGGAKKRPISLDSKKQKQFIFEAAK